MSVFWCYVWDGNVGLKEDGGFSFEDRRRGERVECGAADFDGSLCRLAALVLTRAAVQTFVGCVATTTFSLRMQMSAVYVQSEKKSFQKDFSSLFLFGPGVGGA